MKNATKTWIWILLLLSGLFAHRAGAMSYGFVNVSGNGDVNVAPQLSVDVIDLGGGQVEFAFYNSGPISSAIAEIYFDDGTLLGISSIVNGSGVDFTDGGSNGVNPGNLPGSEQVAPTFQANTDFSTEASDNNSSGVDTGETVSVIFNLINGKQYGDTLAAINDGSLRIGIHVHGITGNDGYSDSFVNSVPDAGSTLLLLGLAMAGLLGGHRRFKP